MKRLISILSVITIVFSATVTYAKDYVSREFAADDIHSILPIGEENNSIQLFSTSAVEPSMDFARLDGKLTVEVTDCTDENAVLIIGEYDENDTLLKCSVIDEVKASNPVDVSGAYERVYLWNSLDMYPLCKSLSTKCAYEIVEGTAGEWEVSADGHTLYNYIGEDSEVVIPNSYLGKRIYIVQNTPSLQSNSYEFSQYYKHNIFDGRKDITNITISEGIQIIGNVAFAGCSSLSQELDLPSTLRAIGTYGFLNCTSLKGNLDLSNLQIMQSGAFYNCSGLNGTLTLPAISTIPYDAFYNCKSLSGNLVIPEGVKVIGIGAFDNCISFDGELVIPEGVETIGGWAFNNNSGSGVFTSLKLPSTLKSIGMYAFQYQTGISNSITLPEGLEHIGDGAFNHCTSFSNTTLDIPSTLKTIGGDYGVSTNTGYGSHVFYDSFKYVTAFNADSEYFKSQDGVLYSADMTRLVAYPTARTDASFIVPEGVVQIDEMVLANTNLTDVTIPDSYIMQETIPDNVLNNMANNLAVAFYHYNAIKNVWVNDTNPNYTGVDGILYSKDLKDMWYVPSKHTTGKINVIEGTENIKKGVFYIENTSTACESYIGVHIPSSVINIHQENITSINLRTDITVDENNEYYTVIDGKLTKK